MQKRSEKFIELIERVAEFIEQGAMAIFCDEQMNALTNPVIVDNLVIGNFQKTDDGFTFALGWRPMGISREFESGVFNVEDPEFLQIDRYEAVEDKLIFHHNPMEDERSVLYLLPIDDEHRPPWEEWNDFKLKNRDLFGDLDMEMADLLNYVVPPK